MEFKCLVGREEKYQGKSSRAVFRTFNPGQNELVVFTCQNSVCFSYGTKSHDRTNITLAVAISW